MLRFLLIFTTLLSYAQAREFQSGDILLQSMRCYVCNMISAETDSIYNHIGLVLEERGQLVVVQALGTKGVHAIPLSQFLAQSNGVHWAHLRLKNLHSIQPKNFGAFVHNHFVGRSYDPYYLWGNTDERGELLYCSELIAKIFNQYFNRPIFSTIPMSFSKYFATWESIIGKGKVPHGKPGIYPGAFYLHPALDVLSVY